MDKRDDIIVILLKINLSTEFFLNGGTLNKSNNKITELQTILQRESQNS